MFIRFKKNALSRPVSGVLCRVRQMGVGHVLIINLGCMLPYISIALYPPTQASNLLFVAEGVGLLELAARSVLVSPAFDNLRCRTRLVSVAVTKHFCLTAVNRCGTLCCPDFPLPLPVAISQTTFACFYDCAYKVTTFFSNMQVFFRKSFEKMNLERFCACFWGFAALFSQGTPSGTP